MDFLGIISWAAAAIGGQVSALISWVTSGFGVLFGDISSTDSFLGSFGAAVWGVFGSLWGWLSQLWQWFNTHILQQLKSLIKSIHDWLQKILGPYLKKLQAIIKWEEQNWNTYIKPIFNLLQRLRSALVIFRLLGFKWAQALDARITQIESTLASAFFGVLQNLNMLANWINFIIDPFGLFQPNIWLSSIAQSVGAIVGAVFGTMNDSGFTAPPGQYTTPQGYYQNQTMTTRFQQRAQIGLLPEDQSVVTSLRASASALGYSE